MSGDQLGPGDQTNMAFMNTPVTHGSATMIVTGVGADTELGKISGMLSATAAEQSPLTKELNTLTLWIAAAAGLTMIVMFALGRLPGWIAHWKELRDDPTSRINRPRQIYTGSTERKFVPIEQRH